MDAYGDNGMQRTIRKTWSDAFMDGLFGVWFANDDKNDTWLTPTWTLSIELWATFLVYLLAQTVRFYKGR
jgi:peptidoglycan/LPS O-acetylase OafA/YrhL